MKLDRSDLKSHIEHFNSYITTVYFVTKVTLEVIQCEVVYHVHKVNLMLSEVGDNLNQT